MERNNEGAIKIVANCLPFVVPGVILKKREELIPIILAIISQHPDAAARYKLTELLFNLIKKPNEMERKMIVDGFIALASVTGLERTEQELLSQCWNEINNKHSERRKLVSDTCGALAAYVRHELRTSLLFSILQNLSKDRSPLVRESVANNLGLLVSLFEGKDKYNQTQEMLFELLFDPEEDVRSTTKKVLLPIFADWADTLDHLFSHLFARMTNDIDSILNESYNLESNGMINSENDIQRLVILLMSIISLAPRLRDTILLSAPFASSCFPAGNSTNPLYYQHTFISSMQEQALKDQFNQFISQNNILQSAKSQLSSTKASTNSLMWTELIWFVDEFLPHFATMITMVDSSVSPVSMAFINVVSSFAATFGKTFTSFVLRRYFDDFLETKIGQDKLKRGRVLPVYLVGIVGCLEEKELVACLRDLIVSISLEERGWSRDHTSALKESVKLLCKNPELKSPILTLMCNQMATHKSPAIRMTIVTVLHATIPQWNTQELLQKVIPCLVILNSDSDRNIQSLSIQTFANLIMNSPDSSVTAKVRSVLEPLCEDKNPSIRTDLAKTLSVAVPHANPELRDHFVLPKLHLFAEDNGKNANNKERKEMAKHVFEGIRVLSGVKIEAETVISSVLPTLKLLLNEADGFEPSYRTFLTQMMSEMESTLRNNSEEPTPRLSSGSITTSATRSSAASSVAMFASKMGKGFGLGSN
eukprot:TRINITY_DN2412_c0_g1_i3.p1 TRINITY_DN2412_c0_g1~~TRINITY_DN2412_c0_g1_i3.p1  ORF type:complete len:707 (+),score=218.17 TRINITY_DN2412_c0_g1_i3:407-2527(+)